MSTKEKIISEALTLFAKKGYKGTSVKDIADAVGIKDSSLYKHFKSKHEILDTIMVEIEMHIGKETTGLGLPAGPDINKAAAYYAGLNEDGIVNFSKKIFMFYMNDELLTKFWRIGNMEQFQNSRVYEAFRKFFMEDSIEYQRKLFAEMSRQGVFIESDPEVMAMSFYAPIFFLFSKYSTSDISMQEALVVLEKQVREFCRIYCCK